jgi:hypothetical protein
MQISLYCTDLKGYVSAYLSTRDDNIVQVNPDANRKHNGIFTTSVFQILAKNKSKRCVCVWRACLRLRL